MQRGRKSSDSLTSTVVALVPGVRPEPPEELSTTQAAHWRITVARMPADWFTAEMWPMLCQLCRHVSYSRVVAVGLRAFEGGIPEETKAERRFDRLTTIHEREGRAISSLMTRLRLTPQSRYRNRAAFTAATNTPTRKPWETS